MRTSILRSVVVAIVLLCLTQSLDAAAEPRRVNGTIEPDVEVQAAFKRLISDGAGLNLNVVHDLARLTGAIKPENDDARRHLAEQFFLYAVSEKWAVEGYELFVMKNVMRIFQGTLFVSGSDFVIAAAPNIGHEDRTVSETAVYLLAFHDAFTPVKSDSGNPTEYHFRQLEPFLEHVQKLKLAPEAAASRVVLGMYRADPEAALNTMARMTRRAAKTDEQRRALPDLRVEREHMARVRFAKSVGPKSDAAASMKPDAGECLGQLAGSPHWYVRLYVPFVFLQDERLLDRGVLDRLANDGDAIVREGVGNVRDEWQRREKETRKAQETYGGKIKTPRVPQDPECSVVPTAVTMVDRHGPGSVDPGAAEAAACTAGVSPAVAAYSSSHLQSELVTDHLHFVERHASRRERRSRSRQAVAGCFESDCRSRFRDGRPRPMRP